jgi:hypothetical protein
MKEQQKKKMMMDMQQWAAPILAASTLAQYRMGQMEKALFIAEIILGTKVRLLAM